MNWWHHSFWRVISMTSLSMIVTLDTADAILAGHENDLPADMPSRWDRFLRLISSER